MKIDLHIHTTASDGSWTPEILIQQVQAAGIELFSVTDHESTANVAEAQRLAVAAGVSFIPGVEISTTLSGQYFHILGYGINIADSKLQHLLKHNAILLEECDYESIRKLIADGFKIDLEEYTSYQHNPVRGGWKSLSFLIDKGFCRDVSDFFTKLFTAERGIGFPEFPVPSVIIDAIKSAGGAAILAHPGSQFHGTELEATFNYFASQEIDGVECYHPSHNAKTVARAVEWCTKRGLLITGGSDCHGQFVPERVLGVPDIRIDKLQLGSLRPVISPHLRS